MKKTRFNIFKLLKPAVYAWKRKGEWLYVGATKNGLSRCMPPAHGIIGYVEPVLPGDVLEVWWLNNKSDAHEVERSYIQYYRPKYNANQGMRVQESAYRRRANELNENQEDHEWNCLRCGHSWNARRFKTDNGVLRRPSVCAHCRSAYWHFPPKVREKKLHEKTAAGLKWFRENKTGYIGVQYERKTGKYRACITIARTVVRLGRYKTAEDAARAYDAMAKKHFKQYAKLNFPNE